MLSIYLEARAVHYDRLTRDLNNELIFITAQYDLPTGLLGPRFHRVSYLRAFWCALTTRQSTIEINEPTFVRSWPLIFVVLVANASRGIVRSRVPVVFYAIENQHGVHVLARRLGILRRAALPIYRWVVRQLLRQTSAVAFGTSGARDLYVEYWGSSLPNRSALFEALPSPCMNCADMSKKSQILFLGSFEYRKGIDLLMTVWERLPGKSHGLILVGKGPLAKDVEKWARLHNARFVLDPSRSRIHTLLAESEILVLPSRRMSDWREQVGLPIVEGLAHGVRIVTSSETGLATWLVEKGHSVYEGTEADHLLGAIEAAKSSSLTASIIRASLPAVDGRLRAGDWLSASSPRGADHRPLVELPDP